MRRVAIAVAAGLAVVGCGAPARLPPAGSPGDEGDGALARASVRFLTPERPADAPAARDGETGGGAYGGYEVPAWTVTPPNRTPRYRQVEHLRGAIAGVVTWRGPVPAPVTTACGPVAGPRIGADRGVAGALVYIERVAVGRLLPAEGAPIAVGGTLVKRGCTLAPAVQIVTPLPAALAIHGDATAARVRIGGTTHALEAGGRVRVQLPAGVTRIDSPDGTLGAAWAHALDTPAYALTDDRGRYRLDQLAAGTYTVTIWMPPPPALVRGALGYGAPVIVQRTVAVRDARTARLDVALAPR